MIRNKIFFILISLIILATLEISESIFAEDIKARFEKRLPVIVDLKIKGLVGENNLGYLQFIGKKKEKEDIVDAENEDRRILYSTIAKNRGVSVEVVERNGAVENAKKAKPGYWIQDADGNWYQKK
jgi:uncharacterized protein YdbL (DUF1318 family)